jgi:hypothetical protein
MAMAGDGSVIFEHQIHVFTAISGLGNEAQLNPTLSLYRVQPDGTASAQTLKNAIFCP